MTQTNGESNAGPRMAKSTGSGGTEKPGKESTVEPLQPSTQPGKKSTGRTDAKFTPEAALEILTKSLLICEQAGLPVGIAPIYGQPVDTAGIFIPGVRIEGKRLVLAEKSTGNPPESTGNQAKSTGSE
jgi:hypothetical protein